MAKSRAKVRRQPAAKKLAAKKPAKRMRDSLGPTKRELRCATKNCYLGGSKALYEASAQQRRARSLRAKKASAAARRP